MRYVDPDGRWIQFLVGASVGALLSGVTAAVDSYISDGTINWNTVAISAASGAVSGMIAASGIGLGGQIALNGMLGAAAATSDSMLNGNEINLCGLGESIGYGMLAGLFGGAGAGNSAIKSQMNRFGKRIINAMQHNSGDMLKKELWNAYKYYMKNGGKKATVETFKAVLRSTVSPVIEISNDGLKEVYNEFILDIEKVEE